MPRRYLYIVAAQLLLLSDGVADQATLTETILPSEICRGLILVPLTYGEAERSETLHFLLDTGASANYIDSGALGRVTGRTIRGGSVRLANARVGEFELGSVKAGVLDLSTIGLAVGRRVDGIVGFPAFRDVLLTLDYPAGEVRVSSGRLPKHDGNEIFRYRGFRRPFLDVEVGDRRVRVLIDSGSTGRFALMPDKAFRWSEPPRPASTAVAVDRVIVREGGRLAQSIRVGPAEFDEPIVVLLNDESLIGYEVLRRFSLTFDQKRKRVRMRLDDTRPTRLDSWVGLGAGVRPRQDGFEILTVFPGTSAEESGLRKGDLVVAVDGTRITERGCDSLFDPPAGRRMKLTYRRDGVEVETEILADVLIP